MLPYTVTVLNGRSGASPIAPGQSAPIAEPGRPHGFVHRVTGRAYGPLGCEGSVDTCIVEQAERTTGRARRPIAAMRPSGRGTICDLKGRPARPRGHRGPPALLTSLAL